MEVQKDLLRELYETLPVEEVMRRLGIKSTTTLYKLLRKAGITLKNNPPIKLVD